MWWIYCCLQSRRTHVLRFHFNPLNLICIFFLLNFSWNLSLILQIFLSHVTFLGRVLDVSSLGIKKFVFSSPFDELVNSFIDVRNENVLYNWTDRAFMSISKAKRSFKTFQDLSSYYYSGLDQCLLQDKILCCGFICIHKYVCFLNKIIHNLCIKKIV